MRVTDNHPGHALLQDFLGAVDIALSCEVLSLDDADAAWDLAEGDLSPGHRRHGHGGARVTSRYRSTLRRSERSAPQNPVAALAAQEAAYAWRQAWVLAERPSSWFAVSASAARPLPPGHLQPRSPRWALERQARRLPEVPDGVPSGEVVVASGFESLVCAPAPGDNKSASPTTNALPMKRSVILSPPLMARLMSPLWAISCQACLAMTTKNPFQRQV